LEDFIAVVEGREQLLEEPAGVRPISANVEGSNDSFYETSGFWRRCRNMFQAIQSANVKSRSSLSA
jgi:hypothetical protein